MTETGMTKAVLCPGLDSNARGRNGWFRPKTILVHRFGLLPGDVAIEVTSKRRPYTPPIWLRLTNEDAAQLAATILSIAKPVPWWKKFLPGPV